MIREFQGEYRWLSNFSLHGFWLYGEWYPTNEHYYQAAKCLDHGEYTAIREALTPGQAKYLGQRCKMRSDWDDVKDIFMYEGVLAKFTDNTDIRNKLLATADEYIQEGNTWGDMYWGVDTRTGKGKNKLGLILMSVRHRLLMDAGSFDGSD